MATIEERVSSLEYVVEMLPKMFDDIAKTLSSHTEALGILRINWTG